MGKQSNEERSTPGVSREKAPSAIQPHAPTSDERRGIRPWLSSLPLLSTPVSDDTDGDATVKQAATPSVKARPSPSSASLTTGTGETRGERPVLPVPAKEPVTQPSRQAPENAAARSGAAQRTIAQGFHALRAYQSPAEPAQAAAPLGQAPPALTVEADPEQSVNPLRVISRDLVARGMAAPLVADLLAETVAEYGGQVLTDERAARLALVDILLSRIPRVPLLPSAEILSQGRTPAPLTGTFLITGPAGAGKSTLIAHLALWAARGGQREVTLVNTQGGRIGAAAQANALGAVFDYPVEHLYNPTELRSLLKRRRRDALRLVELPSWAPDQDARELEGWLTPSGTVVTCVPATGQGDDIHEALVAVRRAAPDVVAVLCKTSETRNIMPAIGALTALRQHVGLVAPGAHVADDAPPPDFAALVTAAIRGADQQSPQGKQGKG